MRVLVDENIPVDVAGPLSGHEVATVAGLNWKGIANGELLARMSGRFDALITMDRNLPHQQKLAVQPFGTILIEAPSSRMVHLRPLLPAVLEALIGIKPGEVRRLNSREHS